MEKTILFGKKLTTAPENIDPRILAQAKCLNCAKLQVQLSELQASMNVQSG